MQRVLVLADPILAGHLHGVLEAADIPCLLRNQFLAGAAGELPLNECWPEIWVIEDGDAERARRILTEQAPGDSCLSEAWRCDGCGEILEAQFAACWNCGHWRVENRVD